MEYKVSLWLAPQGSKPYRGGYKLNWVQIQLVLASIQVVSMSEII